MKKSVMYLFFVIIIMFFGSCKKSDLLPEPVDTDAIRAMLVSVSTPTKEAVQTMLSSTTLKLKDGIIEKQTLVEIFPLDSRTYEVYDNIAIKNLVYYEIDQNGNREKLLGIRQEFQIKNGVVDTTTSVMSYEVGCPYSRYFHTGSGNISSILYFFVFDNGRQFNYFGESETIKLPPIAGGKWKMEISFYDGDLFQKYNAELLDFYAASNQLSLKLNVKKENTVAYFQLSKEFAEGSYYLELRGEEDSNGNFPYYSYRISDQNYSANLTFASPFEIKSILMCGNHGCCSYEVKVKSYSPLDGKAIYMPK